MPSHTELWDAINRLMMYMIAVKFIVQEGRGNREMLVWLGQEWELCLWERRELRKLARTYNLGSV